MKSKGFKYERDEPKYVYGQAKRLPAEKLFVMHVNEMISNHPEFKMRLMGTSGVHGEKFPLYLTACDFQLPDEESVESCLHALKESDELIRRRIDAAWNWEMAWSHDSRMKFFVNWFDTAYFLKNKMIFQGKDHSRYALDFGLDVQEMEFQHFRITEEGYLEEFDDKNLNDYEEQVYSILDTIEFPREYQEKRF